MLARVFKVGIPIPVCRGSGWAFGSGRVREIAPLGVGGGGGCGVVVKEESLFVLNDTIGGARVVRHKR